jgi:ankyrin repeat protein
MLLKKGTDVNAVEDMKRTALQLAAEKGHVDVVKVLVVYNADLNAGSESKFSSALDRATSKGRSVCALYLICVGAKANSWQRCSPFFDPILDRLDLLQAGKRIETSAMSKEERKFMWNLAFFFTIKLGGASGFKSFSTVRSFITFKGIFMASGYGLGDESIWNKHIEVECGEWWFS